MEEISVETTRGKSHRYDITQMQANRGGTNIWRLYVDGDFWTSGDSYREMADEIERIER